MKPLLRFGAVAALFGLLIILAAPGGGVQEPGTAEAASPSILTLQVDSQPDGATGFQFSIDTPIDVAGCLDDSETLADGGSTAFSCDTPTTWTVTITPATGFDLVSFACVRSDIGSGGYDSDFTVSPTELAAGVIGLDFADGEDLTCLASFRTSAASTAPAQLALAVVADPNVIPCGGTTNLTATARDINGHVVLGLGYHWSTDIGLLNVGPLNTAEAEDNHATLTLYPGMETATVSVWVGPLGLPSSTQPSTVTVQQFCPGVTVENDQSKAPGAIVLSSSSNTATCGEVLFIGARVRDSKNQVVQNDTVVSFLASAGEFQTGPGKETSYSAGGTNTSASASLNTVSQYNAATVNGVLNITYIAPLLNGDVSITAASGDKFAKLTIKVSCPTVPAASAGSSGQAACIPIGDGICIKPPNTGRTITPPSTGDAGMK